MNVSICVITHQQEAEEKFKRLTHVYQVLSDADRRSEYDRFGEEDEDDVRHFYFTTVSGRCH